MQAKKIKETLTLFNNLLSISEKDETNCLLQSIIDPLSETKFLVIKILKGEDKIGLVSKIETDFEIEDCIVKYSKFVEQFKQITSKKDEVTLLNIVLEEINYIQILKDSNSIGLLEYQRCPKSVCSAEEIKIAECNTDYWNEIFPIQKLINRKSLFSLTNHLFINCDKNQIKSVNTDESSIILNSIDATIFKPCLIAIRHNLLNTFFNWSSKLKGDILTISKKVFPDTITYIFSCDGYEFILPKLDLNAKFDETVFFEKLENLVLSYDISDMTSDTGDSFKAELTEINFKKDIFFDYNEFRFAKKVLNPILEGLLEAVIYIPSDNLKPLFFEYKDDMFFQKAMVFPIDKNLQKMSENSDNKKDSI